MYGKQYFRKNVPVEIIIKKTNIKSSFTVHVYNSSQKCADMIESYGY